MPVGDLLSSHLPSDIISKCLFEDETRQRRQRRRHVGETESARLLWRIPRPIIPRVELDAVCPYSRSFSEVRNSRERGYPRGPATVSLDVCSRAESSAPLLTWFHPASNVERPTCHARQTQLQSSRPSDRSQSIRLNGSNFPETTLVKGLPGN